MALSFPIAPIPQVSILFPFSRQPNICSHSHYFPIDIPIPSNSHSRSPYINDYVEQLMEIVTALSFVSQRIIVLATQIYDTIFLKTIHRYVTEHIKKSHCGPLSKSHKDHKV